MSAPLITTKLSQLRGDVVLTSLANGDVLTYDSGAAKWKNVAPSGGGGGIGGATGSTDNAILRADGTGGATAQGSAVTVDDSGNLATSGYIIASNGVSNGYVQSHNCFLGYLGNVSYLRGIAKIGDNDVELTSPTANTLVMRNGAAEMTVVLGPSSTGIQSNSGELESFDNSGNITTISPHAKDAPPDLYEIAPGVDEMERKANIFLGMVNWWATTRRKTLDALDLNARLGAPEDSAAAWAEVLSRRASNRLRCHITETFAEYETRTGKSLCPGDTAEERAAWLTMTPAERWQKTETDRVAVAQSARDAWSQRKAAYAPTDAQPDFPEPEPALYTAQPVPDFLA